MAAIFRKPGQETWWVTYYVNGLRFRHSLRTREERIARLKLKKLEGDLVTGELVQASHTPLVPFLTAFCEHLSTIRTRKSYKNDLSYLRTVFGPVCDALNGLSWACLDFRHSFGSHLAQKGESLYKIAELMGNSPDICRRHYAALVPEQMRDSVEFHPGPHLAHAEKSNEACG